MFVLLKKDCINIGSYISYNIIVDFICIVRILCELTLQTLVPSNQFSLSTKKGSQT